MKFSSKMKFLFLLLASPLYSPAQSPKGRVSGLDLNESSIEEIDSENFPDVIKSFDYPNANIADMVKAMSRLTGINFIVDPKVQGKISIIAPSPITVAEAFQAFLSALAINGYAIVRSGAFWKVTSANKASRDNLQVYKGEYFPEADQYITKIFKLKHANAKNLEKQLKMFLTEKNSKVLFYEEANTIIVSDYGSSIEKFSQIIKELDVPNVHTKVEVVQIKYAAAADLTNKLYVLISGGGSSRSFSPSAKRPGSNLISPAKANSSGISALIPDERTNSIIISGTTGGIKKVKKLIRTLDVEFDPQTTGGIFVYYVKYGLAEAIEKTLNSILKPKTGGAKGSRSAGLRNFSNFRRMFSISGIEDDIRVAHDKNTNSLIITAKKHNFEILKSILDRIDIPKNQVFIKTIIMDMNAEDNFNWDVTAYKFLTDPETGKISGFLPRIGFSSHNFQDILKTPGSESVFSFGTNFVELGQPLPLMDTLKNLGVKEAITENNRTSENLKLPENIKIPSLMSLINILKNQTGGNILSTPQVIAVDNETSSITVGVDAPIGTSTQMGASSDYTTTSQVRKDIVTTLKITPHINPDGQSVRLKIEQKIDSISPAIGSVPQALRESAVTITKRDIKTNIILNDQETAVLGGLMNDEETEVVSKIPILGDLPILGWLFKSKNRVKKKKNLLVFITPKIIKTTQDKNELLKDQIDERLDFIERFMGSKDAHGHEIQKMLSKIPPEKSEAQTAEPPSEMIQPQSSDNIEEEIILDSSSSEEEPSNEDFEKILDLENEENPFESSEL